MKISQFILVLAVPLLVSACLPKKPEINLPGAPAGPVIQALRERRESFSGLKATGSVETVRSGRRRVYDTVGFVLDGLRRLRVEAYGPLGQSLFTLVWNGKDVVVRLEDGRIVRPGPAGLERILGVPMDAGELCAVLSGNLPADDPTGTNAFREPDGSVLLQTFTADIEHRFHVVFPEEVGGVVRIEDSEVRRSGKLVYRVRYGQSQIVSGYPVPKSVLIENPERRSSVTVMFEETEVNIPLTDGPFILSRYETAAP